MGWNRIVIDEMAVEDIIAEERGRMAEDASFASSCRTVALDCFYRFNDVPDGIVVFNPAHRSCIP